MKRTTVESLYHSKDESTELCVYHLRMAAAHFMNGSHEMKDWIAELARQCPPSEEPLQKEGHYKINLDWLVACQAYHEELEKEYDT